MKSLIIFFLFFVWGNNPKDERALNYIEQFSELAVLEMNRSGVPASIKMAQALHESNKGASSLAVNANNHFGIKCKRHWKGGTYYHKDDDLDKKGNLIESCFRSYQSTIDSYVDHTNFLTQRYKYRSLFDLPKTDYKAWARGLQKAGYATDKAYSEKLIRYIETYELHKLDQEIPIH